MTGDDLACAAEALVGAPFRLHGREPSTGLDCVGVLAAALETLGRTANLPNGYPLRALRVDGLDAMARRNALRPASGPVRPGDIVLCRPAPGQVHILIASRCGGFVHAHAGVRRVILSRAAETDWPRFAHLRSIFCERGSA